MEKSVAVVAAVVAVAASFESLIPRVKVQS